MEKYVVINAADSFKHKLLVQMKLQQMIYVIL